MKSTGIVRQVDNLDRVVIPKELCRSLEIEPKTPIEIFIEESKIVLKKHEIAEGTGKCKGNLGIIRRVDGLDRIVIPKEICKILGIEPKNTLEIFVDENRLILGKYESGCIFCREVENLTIYCKKPVCKECIKKLNDMIK